MTSARRSAARQQHSEKHHHWPAPNTPLFVTDGTEHVGMVVEGIEHDDRTFAAFDADGHLIGRYPTCAEAMRAFQRKVP